VPLMMSPRMSQTSGRSRSTRRFALFTVCTKPVLELRMMNGFEELQSHVLRDAALWSFSSGPTTITERPE